MFQFLFMFQFPNRENERVIDICNINRCPQIAKQTSGQIKKLYLKMTPKTHYTYPINPY